MSDEAADIAQITEGLSKAIGVSSGLNSTLKFDFEGKGIVFVDGKSNPNSVSNENKPADCTITVSLDTFKKMVAREIDGTAAFMQGKLKVAGDMSVAMKLGPILAKAAPQ
jgi:putative sterol carrier protein